VSELLKTLKSDWQTIQHGALAHVPLYHQIYSVLKSAIVNGTIPYDSKLPTEKKLATSFGVSRITAKRAMDELAAENLIVRFRGKGSHVTYKYKPQPVKLPLVDMLENLIEMGKHSIVHVESIDEIVPPPEIRDLLSLDEGQKVHKVVRVRGNDDNEPYAYYMSYTVGIRKGFTKRNLERTPRLDILKDNGIFLAKIEQVLSAENASARIAADLEIEPGAALLSIRRISVDDDGKVVDVLDGWYNPKRFQYSMVLGLN